MTNPATLRRTVPAIGNGVATSFPFAFKVFAAGDVAVARTVLETGVETVLTLGSDYLVSLNSDQDATPGGSVTYPVSGALLDSGHSLTVYGDTDYTQDLDLAGGGKFNPTNIENALDRLSFQIQQLLEQMSRSLTAAVSTPSGADFTLPAPVADSLLGWDSTGLKFKNFPFSSIASNVTGNMNVTGTITAQTAPGAADSSALVPTTAWVWARLAWGNITGKPTTVSGLGITDTVRRLLTGVALPGADIGLIWHDDYNSLMTYRTVTGVGGGTSYTGYASVEVGNIEDCGSEVPPAGWLECDGSSLSRTTYAALFARIGTLHGTVDGSHFNLPNHQGLFKRAWSNTSTTDPDRTSRTAAAAGGATGNHVGTMQLSAMQSHYHDMRDVTTGNGTGGGGYFVSDGSAGALEKTRTTGTGGVFTAETRPVNVAVMSIIKY